MLKKREVIQGVEKERRGRSEFKMNSMKENTSALDTFILPPPSAEKYKMKSANTRNMSRKSFHRKESFSIFNGQ